MPDLLIQIIIILVKIVALTFMVVLPLVPISVYFERRFCAIIQDRVGPNRTGIPLTLLQLAPNAATRALARTRRRMRLDEVFISLVRGVSTGHNLDTEPLSRHGVKPYFSDPNHFQAGLGKSVLASSAALLKFLSQQPDAHSPVRFLV